MRWTLSTFTFITKYQWNRLILRRIAYLSKLWHSFESFGLRMSLFAKKEVKRRVSQRRLF
jgi:hypothetical protein